ncbi:hypothetical protein [Mycobacterium sp. 1423905.2]|nr:hypothetical protein [Mycobacterium sp. 1423905.2]
MSRHGDDDAPDSTPDETESKDDEQVVPEAGEGPFPPLTGHPRPPIGN